MTYVEEGLRPLGFRFVKRDERYGVVTNVVLSIGHLKMVFDCVCPAYPSIRALGCPVHHKGPGGSWPVEDAKKVPAAVA